MHLQATAVLNCATVGSTGICGAYVLSSTCLAHRGSTVFLLLQIFSKAFGAKESPSSGSLLNL